MLSGEQSSEALHAGASDSRAAEGQRGREFIYQGADEGCFHYALCLETVLSGIRQRYSFSSMHCPLSAKTTQN